MIDRCLFVLPTRLDEYLAALATIQRFDYWRKHYVSDQLKRMAEEQLRKLDPKLDRYYHTEYKLFYSGDPNHFAQLRPAFPDGIWLNAKYPAGRGEFDFIYTFNADEAYQVSLPTQRPMANAFSLMCGSDADALPDLSNLHVPAPIVDMLVLYYPGAAELLDKLTNEHPEITWHYTSSTDEEHELFQIEFSIINQARMVVGLRSGVTYYASAIGRGVFELYPTDRHKRWLSKWSNKTYQMYYGDNYSVDKIWTGVMALWTTICKASQECPVAETRSTPTEAQTSRAGIAGES